MLRCCDAALCPMPSSHPSAPPRQFLLFAPLARALQSKCFACICSCVGLKVVLRVCARLCVYLSSFMSNVQAKVTVEDVLKNPKFPPDWPYSANDFKRMDESEDEVSCVCVCVCVCLSMFHVLTWPRGTPACVTQSLLSRLVRISAPLNT
jgi:hypothetical protein